MNNRICKIAFVIGLLMASSSVYGQDLSVIDRKINEANEEFWRKKRGKKNKGDKGEGVSRTVSSEEIKATQEVKRKQDQKRAEEEQKRREKAFLDDKEEMSKSLKGLNGSGKSSGYSTGLRSLSDDNPSTRGKSKFSSGLRMYSEESPSTNSHQKGTYEAYFSEETKTYEHSSYDNRSSLSKEAVTTFSPAKSVSQKPQKSHDYMPIVVETGPRPVYYQGPAFYTLGAEEESGESLIDKVENQIDVWREAGEHKVLAYTGEKLTSLARKTVSTKSAMGAQVMKVYDIINDALGVFNLQKNIATRTVDAVKKSAITEDSRYVDEVNRQNKADVDNHYHRYMVDHGLLPPDAKQSEKQMKKEIKKEAEKTAEIWLGRIIK